MRNKLIVGGVVVVLGIVLIVVLSGGDKAATPSDEGQNDETVAEAQEGMQTVADEGTGITFTYKAGNGGYRLIEPATTQYGDDSLVKAYVMMPEEDYQRIERGEYGAGEAPPTITLFVLNDADDSDATEWARAHNLFTNIELAMGTPTQTTVGGADALQYRADGLYAMDTYIVSSNGKKYVISGSFISAGTPITADFAALLGSISFN